MNIKSIKSFISTLSPSGATTNEYVLRKILDFFFCQQTPTYKEEYILGNINSKDLQKLLTMMENKEKAIRKLSLLVLAFLLQNSQSKMYFLEKCGLGLKLGKVYLTRFKYLTLNIKDQNKSLTLLDKILKNESVSQKDLLFWYIPLVTNEKQAIEAHQIDFKDFMVSHIELNKKKEIDVDKLPDPIYNLCGIDFTEDDLKRSCGINNASDMEKLLDGPLCFEELEKIAVSTLRESARKKTEPSMGKYKKEKSVIRKTRDGKNNKKILSKSIEIVSKRKRKNFN